MRRRYSTSRSFPVTWTTRESAGAGGMVSSEPALRVPEGDGAAPAAIVVVVAPPVVDGVAGRVVAEVSPPEQPATRASRATVDPRRIMVGSITRRERLPGGSRSVILREPRLDRADCCRRPTVVSPGG